MTINSCPECHSALVEYSSAMGASVCGSCGTVIEENTITAEIGFVEGGDGSSRMVGNFVSADRSGMRSMSIRNRRLNTAQSREETIANAKRKIQEVAYALKGLNDYHIDRAVQCYKLALMNNFTQGRRLTHIIAACLYIVCRQEKTMHMLLDFSDVLRSNVYSIGNVFLQMIRILNLRLPLIDPSLYLSRFAAKLELGDKTHEVTTDALRLVQRMKRDWMHYGRRPSGICGACLLIAARMHGFKRSQNDVIRVVKICDMTLRKRLNEFMETPSAELSVDQFRITELSEEVNPPSYKSNSNRVKLQVAEAEEEDGRIEAEMTEAMKLGLSSTTWKDSTDDVSKDVAEWTDLDDNELDDMILLDEEKKSKQNIWEGMNQDWEEQQELKRKRLEEQSDEEEKPETQQRQKRKYVRKTASSKHIKSSSLSAAREVLQQNSQGCNNSSATTSGTSKKINYEMLQKFANV